MLKNLTTFKTVAQRLELLEFTDSFFRKNVKNPIVDQEIRKMYQDQIAWNDKARLKLAKELMKGG